MNEPLQPVSSPFALAGNLGLSLHQAAGWLFIIAVALWALFTLVAIYHWVRYSHAALLAIPSILVHLFVSGVLILFTFGALSGI